MLLQLHVQGPLLCATLENKYIYSVLCVSKRLFVVTALLLPCTANLLCAPAAPAAPSAPAAPATRARGSGACVKRRAILRLSLRLRLLLLLLLCACGTRVGVLLLRLWRQGKLRCAPTCAGMCESARVLRRAQRTCHTCACQLTATPTARLRGSGAIVNCCMC